MKTKKIKTKLKKPSFRLFITFWILVGSLALIFSLFFVPLISDLFKGPQFLLPFIIFSSLGGFLLFLTLKEGFQGKLRFFLILTGVSSLSFFLSIFLHNFFYAAAILTGQIMVFAFLFEILQGLFFLVAVIGCPLGCLVGMIGSGFLISKKYF